jgi:hypothetical protein
LNVLLVGLNILRVSRDCLLGRGQAGLDGLGHFQIVGVEVYRFGRHVALSIADAIYRDPKSRDQDGGSHLLLAHAETLWLLHLGIIGKNDGDVSRSGAHDQSLSGSCGDHSLNLDLLAVGCTVRQPD